MKKKKTIIFILSVLVVLFCTGYYSVVKITDFKALDNTKIYGADELNVVLETNENP